jgi:hypothetical protein
MTYWQVYTSNPTKLIGHVKTERDNKDDAKRVALQQFGGVLSVISCAKGSPAEDRAKREPYVIQGHTYSHMVIDDPIAPTSERIRYEMRVWWTSVLLFSYRSRMWFQARQSRPAKTRFMRQYRMLRG